MWQTFLLFCCLMTLFETKKPSKVNLLYEESCCGLFKISLCFLGWTEGTLESCVVMIGLHAKI